jgi:glycine/D-amino acid oxidase-like deaminating enzyme
MAESFDTVVVGAGVVGASTAFHLAKWGGRKICIVDRGPVCGGGTAKSCAIVRTHYSVPANTALAVDSIRMFENFADWLHDGDAECGFVNTGYLIVVPEGEFAEKLKVNLVMQAGTGANTYPIPAEEALERHPLLDLDGIAVIGYEPESGYADPYLTTMSFINAGRRLGVTVKTDCPVDGLLTSGGKVTGVRTNTGDIHAGTVVSAIGPWTRTLTDSIGLDIPMEVSRHIVLTFRGPAPYESTFPVVKDLATGNKMYFRAASGGDVLVGTGDHGDPVSGPDAMDENVPDDFVALQGGQLARRMPSFADCAPTANWVGPYDITPDWNPVLGPAPGIDGLVLAFGFSGHGFKLAPAVGSELAKSILDTTPSIPLAPYRLSRFDEGALLTGAYGIGSIS